MKYNTFPVIMRKNTYLCILYLNCFILHNKVFGILTLLPAPSLADLYEKHVSQNRIGRGKYQYVYSVLKDNVILKGSCKQQAQMELQY